MLRSHKMVQPLQKLAGVVLNARGKRRAREFRISILIAFIALTGCASQAPSFVLFGAYFPAWMLCALIGILGAFATRGIFVATGLNSVLPYQLFVCSSAGLFAAILTWLLWFG